MSVLTITNTGPYGAGPNLGVLLQLLKGWIDRVQLRYGVVGLASYLLYNLVERTCFSDSERGGWVRLPLSTFGGEAR